MERIKISILVPIYGTREYIARCAHSLFRQSYENIEYIFVNDCTKDDSVEILKQIISKYPNRKDQIKIINHVQNGGLAKARLTGIENATGDYIWCVDSDDYVDIQALSILEKYISQGYDMIFFNYIICSNKGKNTVQRDKITVKSLLSMLTPFTIWSAIIKSSLITSNKILPIEHVDFSEDYVMMSRLIVSCRNYINAHESLYYYNVMNLNSYMHNIDKNKIIQSCIGAIKIHDYLCNKKKGLSAFYYYISLRYIQLYRIEKSNPILSELSDRMYSINHIITHILMKNKEYKTYDLCLKAYRYIICRMLDVKH